MTAGDRLPEPLWSWRFRLPAVTLPTWARDQPHQLLYVSTVSGVEQLHHHDVRSGRLWQVTRIAGGASLGAISPTGAAVWWFGDGRGDELGRWHITETQNEETEVVGGTGHPAGIALGSEVAVIGMSTADGSTISLWTRAAERTIFRNPLRCSVAGLSADDALIGITHQRGTDARHPVLAILNLAGGTIADRHEDGPGRLWPGEWSPVRGDRRLIVHHEPEDRRRAAIWTPEDDSWQAVDVDLPGDVWASWYPAGDALLLRHELHGRSQLYRWQAGQTTMLPTPRGHLSDARVHPSGQLWVAHSASDQPPRLLGVPNGLRSDHTSVSAKTLHARYRDVRAGDVHAFIACPPGSPVAPPGIVLLHGGPAAHDSDDFSPEVQAWVDHGVAVVLINYSGSSGYGSRWRESIREDPGPGLRELEDIAAVRARVISDGLVDSARMIIAGRSWGGYLALLAAGRQPELWRLGIATMPVADWSTAYEDELAATQEHDRALFGGSPMELPDFYAERSPISFVDRVRIPLLLVVSRNDPHSPRRQIDNYVQRLAAAGRTVEVHEYEVGHAARRIADQLAIQSVQLDFAMRHLTDHVTLAQDGRPLPAPPSSSER